MTAWNDPVYILAIHGGALFEIDASEMNAALEFHGDVHDFRIAIYGLEKEQPLLYFEGCRADLAMLNHDFKVWKKGELPIWGN